MVPIHLATFPLLSISMIGVNPRKLSFLDILGRGPSYAKLFLALGKFDGCMTDGNLTPATPLFGEGPPVNCQSDSPTRGGTA